MKITLQSTSTIANHNGIKCRVWEGTTAAGIACYALIPVIAHHKDDDARATEFMTELQAHEPPSERALQCFNIRSVL